MRHVLAFFILTLAGCHFPASSQPLPGGGGGAAYGSTWSSQPIQASLWFDERTGVASFDLSRRGHVAVFALEPMGRMELIYPAWGHGSRTQRAFRSGRHSVRTDSRLYHLAVDRRDRPGYGRSTFGVAAQTYIILIASERPLRLGQLMATGSLPWLDHPSVTWNPFLATDQLAREIVPNYRSDDWTVAYHVVWPATAWNRYDGRTRYTQVRCPGNIVIAVPLEAIRVGAWRCPRQDRPDQVARPRSPAVPPVTETLPKRPRPVDWQGATPTDDRGRGALPGTPSRRPAAGERDRARPAPTAKPTPRPAPAAKPEARPAPAAKPAPRPAPAAKPEARPAPSAKPTGKAKPKKDGDSDE